jgi:small-conductance mechanosensitive channel
MASDFSDKNFSGQNLRGRSFKGQDLAGANFSFADIRGANFAGAKLQDANFSSAKAGLQKRWAWILLGLSWLAAGISGFFSAFAGAMITLLITDSSTEQQIYHVAGWVSLVVVVITLISILWRGTSGALAGAGAGALALALA